MAMKCGAKCEVSINCNWVMEEEDRDNDDEALSLCDLPLGLRKQEEQSSKEEAQVIDTEAREEFNFRSWGDPENESAMCTADEVFFRGRMLPLRVSACPESSLATVAGIYQNLARSESSSESLMDHGSSTGFTSNSSRSSSVRSQNSSSSTFATSAATTTGRISRTRVQNQFHPLPSSKPHVRDRNLIRQSSVGSHSRKSVSVWDFVRLGVFSAPEIGLEDLKSRHRNSFGNNSVSRNGSSSKSSNPHKCSRNGIKNADSNGTAATDHNTKSNQGFKQHLGKSGGLLTGCKCTAETIQTNIVIIKNSTKSTDMISESATHAAKEKVFDLKKQRAKQGKQAMSHRRIFEWLKELPHATYSTEIS